MSSQCSYFGQFEHEEVQTCRLWKSKEAENTAGRSSSTGAMNVSLICQMCSDVFTAIAVLFRRAKRDKLSWNINIAHMPVKVEDFPMNVNQAHLLTEWKTKVCHVPA